MPDTRQALRKLLANGETEKLLAALKSIFEKTDDSARLADVVLLANRSNQNKSNFHRGILSQADFGLENNKIAAAISNLIENVPPSADFPAMAKTAAGKTNWEKWALVLGIFAAVAGAVGYNFFKKQEPAPVQIPAAPAEKTEKTAAPIAKPEQKTATEKPGKNSPNIILKDKAKVGNIITGDSNTINIKQDF